MSNITRDSMNFRDFPSIMDERFLGTFQHQQNFLATQTLRAGSNGSDYHLSAEGSIIGEEDYSRIDQDLQQNAKWSVIIIVVRTQISQKSINKLILTRFCRNLNLLCKHFIKI